MRATNTGKYQEITENNIGYQGLLESTRKFQRKQLCNFFFLNGPGKSIICMNIPESLVNSKTVTEQTKNSCNNNKESFVLERQLY